VSKFCYFQISNEMGKYVKISDEVSRLYYSKISDEVRMFCYFLISN
jgi:hypothetical protein